MTPGTLAIIMRAFPPRQHGLAIGLYGGISGLGLIAGPVLGGLLVQGENWRPIFLVNVPLGVAALVMAALFVPQSREARDPVPVGWPGLTLLSSGLLCLLFGFTRASDAGWTNVVVIVSCLFGLVLLALFAMTEWRVRWPLVDLALFRNRPFVIGCLSFFSSQQHFWSAALLEPVPAKHVGIDPTARGSGLLTGHRVDCPVDPLSGLLAQWAGPRPSVILVLALLAIGVSFFYVAVTLTPQSTYVGGLLPTFLVRGLAIPVVSSCTTLAVMSAVPTKQSGLASGTLGMARNIGTAFGVAVLSQVYLFHTNSTLPSSLTPGRAAAERREPRDDRSSDPARV